MATQQEWNWLENNHVLLENNHVLLDNGNPTRVEFGKEWFDDNIVELQMPNIVKEPVSDE